MTILNQRILIIEDDHELRRLTKKKLATEGFEVIEAENGRVGIDLFNRKRFNLVITDLIMPEKDGLETIRDIKKASPDVKIVAISGGGASLISTIKKMLD